MSCHPATRKSGTGSRSSDHPVIGKSNSKPLKRGGTGEAEGGESGHRFIGPSGDWAIGDHKERTLLNYPILNQKIDSGYSVPPCFKVSLEEAKTLRR